MSLVVLSITGCGGGVAGRPQLAPVSGTVLYNGEPLAGATVTFWAEKSPRDSTGVTNDKGEFRLSMFDVNDGAMIGENKVTVVKSPPSSAAATPRSSNDPPDPADMAKMSQQLTGKKTEKPAKPLVPAKYANAGTTPLKQTVAVGAENKFVLQLTD